MSDHEPETQDAPASEPEAPEPEKQTPGAPAGEPEQPDAGPLEIPTPTTAPGEGELTGPTAEPSEDEQQEGEQPEPEPEQEQPQGLDEKALEKRHGRLRAQNERHAKRVGEIMEDDATDLIPCPVCMDGIAGWIYPPDVAPLEPEAVSRIRTVIGLPDYTTFRQAPDAEECPECGGLGEVITGSHVPGYETKTCSYCKKLGWVPVGKPSNGRAELPEVPSETGPDVYANDESNDPEIQHLRERGFTVIPPMKIQAGNG